MSGVVRGDGVHLVETFEYFVQLFGVHAFARITDADDGISVFIVDRQGDGVGRTGMLEGVGQQVVDHLLHLFLVVPYLQAIGSFLENQVYLPGVGILQEQQIVLIQKVYEVVTADLDFHVSLFLFAEVEQFVDQFA